VSSRAQDLSEPEESGAGLPDLKSLLALLPGPRAVLVLVLLFSLLARASWLNEPKGSLIFDETYYVNAARVILSEPVPDKAPYADAEPGLDPNREHPPLGKLLIAGSMKLFGDGPTGWRAPSIVAGMFSILLLYGIVRAAGGDEWLAVLAAAIFALDNLVLVHSRIGTLDMFLVVFMLLGSWLYLRGWKTAGGAACGVAALVKLGGFYAVFVLILIEVVIAARAWWTEAKPVRPALLTIAKILAAFFAVYLIGLYLLDQWVTNFSTPWGHLKFMLDYGFALKRDNGPANQESYPWQWLINDVQMTYARVDEQVKAGDVVVETRAVINFRGAMNPIVIAMALPAFAFAGWRAWKFAGDRLSLWTIAWVVGTYAPFFPASMLSGRISYIFYFLPTMAGVSVGSALLLRKSNLPLIVTWAFLAAIVIGFIGYFPIRRF
jgi:predicted membrane-bound dolichyl-phosphate-mannose-protein mannosyltransferase